jgi:hypothetical protein
MSCDLHGLHGQVERLSGRKEPDAIRSRTLNISSYGMHVDRYNIVLSPIGTLGKDTEPY